MKNARPLSAGSPLLAATWAWHKALLGVEAGLRRIAVLAHGFHERAPSPRRRSLYFTAAKAMLAATKAADRPALALWKAKSGYPAPGWAQRGLPQTNADPELAASRSCKALTLNLIQETSTLRDPALAADAIALANLRAFQLSGDSLCTLGAQFVIENLEGPCPEAAMAFRMELTRLDPGWHRRGFPNDGVGELLSRNSAWSQQLRSQEIVQDSLEEAKTLSEQLEPLPGEAEIPKASKRRL